MLKSDDCLAKIFMIRLLDIGFRFGAVALLALLGFLVFRQRRERMPALIAVAFATGLIAYLMCSAPFWSDLAPWLQAVLAVGCVANPLLFWLLALSIFEDGFRLQTWHVGLFVIIEVLGLWYIFAVHGNVLGSPLERQLGTITGIALQLLAVAFVLSALIIAHRGRVPDLVENRRRFRTLFVSVTGVYMLFVLLVEIFLRGEVPHPAASLLNAGAIFAIVITIAVFLLTLRFNLLLEPARPLAVVELDQVEQTLMLKLNEAIANKLYRRDNLTIGNLAQDLQAQEYRLRALINTKMGFRNFNDFLNRHRISDACAQLADPALAGTPILTIALNLGYGSIGPFNRAFKQATGLTPTEHRRQKRGLISKSQAAAAENAN
jgi:AraC-like DNA-binding protein